MRLVHSVVRSVGHSYYRSINQVFHSIADSYFKGIILDLRLKLVAF